MIHWQTGHPLGSCQLLLPQSSLVKYEDTQTLLLVGLKKNSIFPRSDLSQIVGHIDCMMRRSLLTDITNQITTLCCYSFHKSFSPKEIAAALFSLQRAASSSRRDFLAFFLARLKIEPFIVVVAGSLTFCTKGNNTLGCCYCCLCVHYFKCSKMVDGRLT